MDKWDIEKILDLVWTIFHKKSLSLSLKFNFQIPFQKKLGRGEEDGKDWLDMRERYAEFVVNLPERKGVQI